MGYRFKPEITLNRPIRHSTLLFSLCWYRYEIWTRLLNQYIYYDMCMCTFRLLEAWASMYINGPIQLHTWAPTYLYMFVCAKYMYIYVFPFLCMYACMEMYRSLRRYVCMYVGLYLCMYVCVREVQYSSQKSIHRLPGPLQNGGGGGCQNATHKYTADLQEGRGGGGSKRYT